MLKITQSDKAVALLVADRPDIQKVQQQKLFCTISPNANTQHVVYKRLNGKRVCVKMPYGKLPQRVQYDYCLRVLTRCYMPFLSIDADIVGTWELNEKGNVHFHFLIRDKLIHNKTQLEVFQRDVLNCEESLKNMFKNGNMIDRMNNIVYLNKPLQDIVKYMDKDYEMNKGIFNNYYLESKSSDKLPDVKKEGSHWEPLVPSGASEEYEVTTTR